MSTQQPKNTARPKSNTVKPINTVKPRRLLTAAVGVATVSYVVSCGHTPLDDSPTSGNLVAPPETTGIDSTSASSNSSVGVNPGSTISGNLLPPPETSAPPVDTGVISGNLLPPPDTSAPPETSAPPVDTGVISGNLLPPPDASDASDSSNTETSLDARVVDTIEVDASVDAGLVISGNLLPPPDASAPPEEQ